MGCRNSWDDEPPSHPGSTMFEACWVDGQILKGRPCLQGTEDTYFAAGSNLNDMVADLSGRGKDLPAIEQHMQQFDI